MTDEEICKIMDWHYWPEARDRDGLMHRIRKVVEEAQKQEREACALLCVEEGARFGSCDAHFEMADNLAAAIRNRT